MPRFLDAMMATVFVVFTLPALVSLAAFAVQTHCALLRAGLHALAAWLA